MSAAAYLGVLLWVALIGLTCTLAYWLGALAERSRWLVLVRQAAQVQQRARGLLQLIEDSTVIVMHGWRGVPRADHGSRDNTNGREPEPGEHGS